MNTYNLFLILFNCISFSIAVEYVPVYFWGNSNAAQSHSALEKISENVFKDVVLQNTENNPFIVVFAEETLSPEDLVQKNELGEILYPNLHKYAALSQATYLPSVQNPFSVLNNLGKDIFQISMESLLKNVNVPENKVLFVDLNDAKDGELRNEMLKRHDFDIHIIYEKLLSIHPNVLAFYTARHSSWVRPEVLSRKSRNLLQEAGAESEPEKKVADNSGVTILVDNDHLLLVVTSSPKFSTDNGITYKDIVLTADEPVLTSDSITFNLKGDNQEFSFLISLYNNGYWALTSVKEGNTSFTTAAGNTFVLDGFSYHCSDFLLRNHKEKKALLLPGMQIQPFVNVTENANFGDPFDCVGFTTIPIWSGIFISLLLLLILTFGITAMMDIRTMDKFDDAKGKTITINAGD